LQSDSLSVLPTVEHQFLLANGARQKASTHFHIVSGGIPSIQGERGFCAFHGYQVYTKTQIYLCLLVFFLINPLFCIPMGGLASMHSQLGGRMTVPHIPARYDHVGSFLRPAYLLEAREQRAKGQITPEQLRVVEDKAITEIVKFQEDVGLKSITDGEFRRTYFHIDFLEQMGGVKTDVPVTIERPDGTQELAPPVIRVTDKVRHVKDIQLADFNYLKSQIAKGSTPKVTIPSPTMLHFRGGRAGISKDAYPELDPAFYDDVAKAYGDELRSLAAAGCNYVQMDDTNLAYLCDDKMREAARARGDDPNELPHRYAAFINKVVAQKPAGMTLAMHLCRGNFKSTHAAAGNYEPVAEALLSEMNIDAYFLEYDDDRSGDFRPLRFLAKDKLVVLGLVTTKFGAMESKDSLKRRIDEAAKYAPLSQLALSPQCGFSSTVHGNNIAVEDQRNKLRLVVETAQEVWGNL
jgi:5-methyltetrahydropteroyltriglutamate--homocysteine methyltransferase